MGPGSMGVLRITTRKSHRPRHVSYKATSAELPGFPRGAYSMHHRDAYRELFKLLLKLVKDDRLAVYNTEKLATREHGKHSPGFIITGRPGIGKTLGCSSW